MWKNTESDKLRCEGRIIPAFGIGVRQESNVCSEKQPVLHVLMTQLSTSLNGLRDQLAVNLHYYSIRRQPDIWMRLTTTSTALTLHIDSMVKKGLTPLGGFIEYKDKLFYRAGQLC
jgi:hypothetical protein